VTASGDAKFRTRRHRLKFISPFVLDLNMISGKKRVGHFRFRFDLSITQNKKHMKKTMLIFSFLLLTNVLFAQSDKEEIDFFQSVFGMEKKALVAEFIKLEGAPKDAFWTTYDEYEAKRKALGQRRISVLKKYADSYATMDDLTTDEIIKEVITLQGKNDKLIADYYKKIKKGSGTKAAAQFYQIEGYILSKIRSTIMENIPLIGELDKK
jgi:hypothetical protein